MKLKPSSERQHSLKAPNGDNELADIQNKPRRNLLKNGAMILMGMIACIYLLNPDAGIIELIPDNIPIIGNLDEVTATIFLFKVLKHFGFNPFHLFDDNSRKK